MVVSWNRGNPSHHPFLDGIFLYEPFFGGCPYLKKPPHTVWLTVMNWWSERYEWYCGWASEIHQQKDGWNPMDSGINHLSTGAGFLKPPINWCRISSSPWDFKSLVEPSQMVRHDVLTGFLLGLEPRRMVTCESVVFLWLWWVEVSMGEGLCLQWLFKVANCFPLESVGFFHSWIDPYGSEWSNLAHRGPFDFWRSFVRPHVYKSPSWHAGSLGPHQFWWEHPGKPMVIPIVLGLSRNFLWHSLNNALSMLNPMLLLMLKPFKTHCLVDVKLNIGSYIVWQWRISFPKSWRVSALFYVNPFLPLHFWASDHPHVWYLNSLWSPSLPSPPIAFQLTEKATQVAFSWWTPIHPQFCDQTTRSQNNYISYTSVFCFSWENHDTTSMVPFP